MRNSESALGDPGIRPALRELLFRQHQGQADTVIIDELGVCRGQARIDLAVVNGAFHGYEIKSDRDSLRRLAGQVEFYNRVVDRASLIVGDRHLAEASDLVPSWWGLVRIVPSVAGPTFRTIRRGRLNPDRDPRSLAEFLWLDEAIALLAERGVQRGIRGKPRRVVWDLVCDQFNLKEIAAAVRDRLKARAAIASPRQPS